MSEHDLSGTDADETGADGQGYIANELAKAMRKAFKHVSQDEEGNIPAEIRLMISDKAFMKRVALKTISKLEKQSDRVTVSLR
ncbi:hypothetical protein [Histidinibacterium lentulum]|uniref:Uncharacterized protein n=1 Tax=Histidinibacterium lentulum TaxID=2480588 RepID=A0A3N2R7N2_9RHOB|nr:hypothetical protein [Histidinibacterium lentulum]ROU03413.1 hypothetical protein EAT49_03650 [Histidinibacterium lentulum]